jgi:hypothetical protein
MQRALCVQDSSIWSFIGYSDVCWKVLSVLTCQCCSANKLPQDDLTGGSITLSNIGAIGGTYMSPILVPGEAVIGAMGAMQKVPKYAADGSLQPHVVMTMSWCCPCLAGTVHLARALGFGLRCVFTHVSLLLLVRTRVHTHCSLTRMYTKAGVLSAPSLLCTHKQGRGPPTFSRSHRRKIFQSLQGTYTRSCPHARGTSMSGR